MDNVLSLVEVGVALAGLSDAEWKIIDIMASQFAMGLALLTSNDLIHETYVALLSGDRSFPRNVKPVNVVINAMRSEASNCRVREKTGAIDHRVPISEFTQPLDEDGDLKVVPSTNVTPERIAESNQLMLAIYELVKDDPELQDILTTWSLSLRGQDAVEYLEWDMNKYEAARKRLVRRLSKMMEERS